ncbi:MAG: leucine-rich repeat domain-containing protein [Alistipes sp.]|nr:leucine-rich repeat domain-containing protein [Alistipes sp.]
MALKFEYDKEKRTAVVCGVEDEFCEQIVIPSAVEYYRKMYDVVAIKTHAFRECLKLKSVTIPNGVTEIGVCAFECCSRLTNVTIPNGVTEIEGSAFCDCCSLTSITIPNSVTEIGGLAFYGCSSLTSITIPDSVTVIGCGAFKSCSSLTSVTIPNSVTSIGQSAFSKCSSLTSITIPNGVTEIGDSAFSGCSGLKKIEICNDQGRVKIDSGAFYSDVKVTYLGKDAQPKPKQEVKEQPAPEVATPAPTIDLDKLIDAAAAEKQREAQPKKKGFFARLFGKK